MTLLQIQHSDCCEKFKIFAFQKWIKTVKYDNFQLTLTISANSCDQINTKLKTKNPITEHKGRV